MVFNIKTSGSQLCLSPQKKAGGHTAADPHEKAPCLSNLLFHFISGGASPDRIVDDAQAEDGVARRLVYGVDEGAVDMQFGTGALHTGGRQTGGCA